MNSLVSYDSSSDEDKPATLHHQAPLNQVSSSQRQPTGEDTDEVNVAKKTHLNGDEHGPVLGPSIPDGYSNRLEEFANGINEQLQMSDRDMLRLLTQPTHPMTALPSSPPGSPDPGSIARIKRFQDLKLRGVHFNEDLARKETFRNPALFSILLDRTGISTDAQYQSSLPSNVFDLSFFPPSAYKEELLKTQRSLQAKDDADKQVTAAAGKRIVDFTPASQNEALSRASTPGLQTKRKRP